MVQLASQQNLDTIEKQMQSDIDDGILKLLTGNQREAFLPCKLMTWGS